MPSQRLMFHIDDVQWHQDLAVFRSMNREVPWDCRFGLGQVKVLWFDLETQAGTYLFWWPAGYDPLGEHGHGSNCTELVLGRSLVDGDREWGLGAFSTLRLGSGMVRCGRGRRGVFCWFTPTGRCSMKRSYVLW